MPVISTFRRAARRAACDGVNTGETGSSQISRQKMYSFSGLNPKYSPRCGNPVENDAGVGHLAEFAGFLHDDALGPCLDAVFSAAEPKHFSVEPEPAVPALAVQCGLNEMLRLDANALARLECRELRAARQRRFRCSEEIPGP